MKITAPIAASVGILALALALTGCSAGGLPGTSNGAGGGSSSSGGGSTGGGGSAGGPTRTYGANDLVTILKKAEAARHLTGTIKTDAEIKSDVGAAGGGDSLTKSLTAAGGTFSPAACGTLLDSLVAASEKYLNDNDWIGADLSATNDQIDIATAPNDSETAAILAKSEGIMSQVSSQCSTMTIKVGTESIKFNITTTSASTDANKTFAYEEDIVIPGQAVEKTLTIEAVYGNLYIGDVSLTNPSISEMEANVNAVIAASNG